MTNYTAQGALAQLYDFQRATVDQAFRRLYTDEDSTRRFLIADETGLGKTHVAAGIIAKTIEHLQGVDAVKRIDLVYVCSNVDIAEQNLRKLMVSGGDSRMTTAPRLTLLVTYPDLLRPAVKAATKPVTLVGFTPATSFEFGWRTGQAEERAALFLLLAEHMDLAAAEETALKRILQGTVASLDGFDGYIGRLVERTAGRWEQAIQRAFLRGFDRSRTRRELVELVSEVRGRGGLTRDQRGAARRLTGDLRGLLAQASVRALEPDLVILDEFQRFRQLLATDTPAGELAGKLFTQPHARVLLLSATPYKPFTYAEEIAQGEDHYGDFIRTLDFLTNGSGLTSQIRDCLVGLRRAALAGEPVQHWKKPLEGALRRLMSRTERPPVGEDGMLSQSDAEASQIEPRDLAAFVALRRLADMLEAPLTVEYWKSSPYFGNFLDGYKIGEQLKEALKDPGRRGELQPAIRRLQRLHRRDITRFRRVDWGNARLRRLAAETVEAGWWSLLWVPPSLPYHAPGGPYAAPAIQGMTKRLIFSSWVAAPSAIASLLSYEAERRLHTGAGRFDNTPEARAAIASRVQYRLDGVRPASMTALALFWPMPTLAEATDPLTAAREAGTALRSAESVLQWAGDRIRPLIGAAGTARTPASTAWYWAAPLLMETRRTSGRAVRQLDEGSLVEALAGEAGDGPETATPHQVLAAHADLARKTLAGRTPDVERPADLIETVALLGVAAPGNIAWRALRRVLPRENAVSEAGLWRAAAVLASGLRSLFSRPEVTLLLSEHGAVDESAYWQSVARYCHEGNLQSALDEFLHHLVESGGFDAATDQGLADAASSARRALTIRAARYVAVDPEHGARREGIPFLSRFALRFGSIQQEQDDVRLPEVRTAFNSPFWPFVLASTSIGQEGVDFHWWCHAVVHWNLPANPVDFEQREGRINRYKCHAVRRNVASQFRQEALASDDPDPWRALFVAARNARAAGPTTFIPTGSSPGLTTLSAIS